MNLSRVPYHLVLAESSPRGDQLSYSTTAFLVSFTVTVAITQPQDAFIFIRSKVICAFGRSDPRFPLVTPITLGCRLTKTSIVQPRPGLRVRSEILAD